MRIPLFDFQEYIDNCHCGVVFMEATTISQYLKTLNNDPAIKWIKKSIRESLPRINFFNTPIGKKLSDKYVNFFTARIYLDRSWQELYRNAKSKMTAGDPTQQLELAAEYAGKTAGGTFTRLWQGWGDYFSAMGDKLSSKINTINYTPDIIDQEVKNWHEELAFKSRGLPSEEYSVALSLDNIGWKNWKWVSLGRGYCPEEAKAMGHCGNVGARTEDNILSLRDPDGYAHLTFIVNHKMLGESKGRANSKPIKKYHPAIKAILLSPWIDSIKGGGYEPQYNFALTDLSKEDQEEIKKKKPFIDDSFKYITQSAEMDEKTLRSHLEDIFEYDFDSVAFEDNTKIAVLNKAEDFKEIDTMFIPFHNSKVEIGWTEDMEMYEVPKADIREFLRDYIPDEIKTRLINYFEEKFKNTDDEDIKAYLEDGIDSLEELIELDDDIEQAINMANWEANEIGTRDEAYKDVVKQLGQYSENGFYIDFKKHPYPLCIEFRHLENVWNEMNRKQYSFEDMVDVVFNQPYYGYSDFSKEAFTERLNYELSELGIQ